jgi:hypothetical protein
VEASGTAETGSPYTKSSITTRSTPAPSLGPNAALPLVMSTRETMSLPKSTPKNDRLWLVLGTAGAKKVPSDTLFASKNVRLVVFGRVTFVNTEPKPRVSAGVVLPGTKKSTSSTLLPRAVNSFCGEKV